MVPAYFFMRSTAKDGKGRFNTVSSERQKVRLVKLRKATNLEEKIR